MIVWTERLQFQRLVYQYIDNGEKKLLDDNFSQFSCIDAGERI